MARLDELMPELNDDVITQVSVKANKPLGKKRRAWLSDEVEVPKDPVSLTSIPMPNLAPKVEIKDDSKGSINHVYKPESLGFIDLRSNPLQLFRFLFELSRNDDFYNTPRVRLREMMLNINVSKDSARTALRFLLKNNFISRIEFQPGNLGWSRYRLNANVCADLERGLSRGSIDPFEPIGNTASSETTSANSYSADPWDEIDFSNLTEIGFNKNHLLQIKNKTTAEIVQESINHFSYSLKYNKKTKEYSNPLATIIAVLKRGEAWIEPKYQSPQEIAKIKILEMKKAEIERNKLIDDELYKLSFDEWKNSLSESYVESIAPDLRKKGDPIPPHAKLSAYFKDKVWPEINK